MASTRTPRHLLRQPGAGLGCERGMRTAAATLNEGASVAQMLAEMLSDLNSASGSQVNLTERTSALLGALMVLDKALTELRASGVRVSIDPATVPDFEQIERQAFGLLPH